MYRKNLVLITFDALRRDAVGIYQGPGKRLNLTPNLNRFAEESTTFKKSYSNGPATEHSFVSMLSSQYSHETGLNNSETTFLAELLSDRGYHTAAFHSNPVLLSHNNFHIGFDIYPGQSQEKQKMEGRMSMDKYDWFNKMRGIVYSRLRPRLREILRWNQTTYSFLKGAQFALQPPYERAETINNRCFEHISSKKEEPIFLWVHYMDTHDPYLPTGDYLNLDFVPNLSLYEVGRINTWLHAISGSDFNVNELPADTVDKLRLLYYAQVSRVDDAFGKLIRQLKQSGLYEASLIIVGSDHGEQFLEHNWIRHSRHIYDELLKVPLIIKPPAGTDSVSTVSGLTSYIDITPTFLDYADIEVPSLMRGTSLRHAIETGESSRDFVCAVRIFGDTGDRVGAVRNGDWKLIIDEKQEREELYNVSEDPGEQRNQVNECPNVLSELRELFEEELNWSDWKQSDFRSNHNQKHLSDDVQQQLKDLGYE